MREWTIQRRLRVEADSQRLFALCGTRLYSIETLAGTFPDIGWHQPGEMGGVWAPPVKLLDGYWVGIRRRGESPIWLTQPLSWQLAADGATLTYLLPALGLRVLRRSWIVPDQPALVVDVMIEPEGDTVAGEIECGVALRTDLHGAWLSERLGWCDGEDVATYCDELHATVFSDSESPHWTVCAGAGLPPVERLLGADVWGPEHTSGRGTGAALWYAYARRGPFPGLRFLMTGSSSAALPATTLYAQLLSLPVSDSTADEGRPMPLAEAHRQAIEQFNKPFAQCVLRSPDPNLDEAFAWAKANMAWLIQDVPGLGRGPMGGLPDFPWWFGCDTAYGALAMLPVGQANEAVEGLRTLGRISRDQHYGSAVAHEIVSNGIIAWRGNLVEVPLLARALYFTYRWTGNRALLDALFPFCLDGLLHWALGDRLEAGEEVPQGESLVETPEMHSGVQTLDVAVYLAEALDLMAELAVDLDQAHLASALRERARRIRHVIQRDWWLPVEGFFGDLRASRTELEELLARLEELETPDPSQVASMRRLHAALAADDSPLPDDTRRPWLMLHYVQALAAEAGVPTPEQAEEIFARMETPEWSEEHGIVLNAANDRRVMTLPTGALACAEARYGRPDAALEHIRRIYTTLGRATPGTIAEYSPDGGCFLQLWSGYGIIWPIVRYIFGLRPDVARRRLLCVPQLPEIWPGAEVRALPLGDMRADITLERAAELLHIRVETDDPGWVVELGAVAPQEDAVPECARMNGHPVTLRRVSDDLEEQRAAWLAPAVSGAVVYELVVSWTVRHGEPVAAAGATSSQRHMLE